MKEINHYRFSLFGVEKIIPRGSYESLYENDMTYLNTFDSLEEAKREQKEYDFKTIILPSY